ncbi:MAG: HlyD family efflux transporter periplasmic adaptor subunit [Bacteroidales bacterium]
MRLLLFILLIALADGCRREQKTQQPIPDKPVAVRGIGKIVPEQEIIQLAMPVSGNIETIRVAENDSVGAQTPLIILASSSEKEELAVAKAAALSQQAQLKATIAQVNEEEARLQNQQTEYARIERLYQQGAETGQVRENAETELKVQQAVVERTRKELQRETELLAEAHQTVALREALLKKRTLYAPVAGTVLEINVKPGEYIAEGAVIGQFRPNGPKIALCEIDELFAPRIKNGQKAYLLSSGGVDTLGSGTVIFRGEFLKKKSLFYEEAGEAEDRRVLEVKILPDRPLPLLLNSKIECSIHP